MRRRTQRGVALLVSRLVQTGIVILGFLMALSVVAPSFQAADLILIKMLGIGSVAIGFAFQNILAGILLLVSEPFQFGDLISVTGIAGTRKIFKPAQPW
jgi:small conductance mechanosensitive channel